MASWNQAYYYNRTSRELVCLEWIDVNKWGQLRHRRGSWTQALIPTLTKRGYLKIGCWRNGVQHQPQVHTIVLSTFRGPPKNLRSVGTHKDGNPQNCRLSNLRWASEKKNAADRELHGRTAKGEKHGMAKLSENNVLTLICRFNEGESRKSLAEDFGVSYVLVCQIVQKKRWRHLWENE